MITLQKLSEQQAENINVMKKMAGWSIINEVLESSIKLKNADLINFKWTFNDDGEPDKKSVLRFNDIQKEAALLKQFLMFINKPAIIGQKKEGDVYD